MEATMLYRISSVKYKLKLEEVVTIAQITQDG